MNTKSNVFYTTQSFLEEEIELGELMLTHRRRYRKVSAIYEVETSSRLLTTYGNSEAVISDDILVLSRRRQRRNGKLKWTEPSWVPVRYLTTYDFICYPVDEPSREIITSLEAGAYYLAGYLYASGRQNNYMIDNDTKNEIIVGVMKNLAPLEYQVLPDGLLLDWQMLKTIMFSIENGSVHKASIEAQMALWSGWLTRESAVDVKTALTFARIGRSVLKQGVHMFNWLALDEVFYSVSTSSQLDLKRQIYEFGCVWSRIKKNINYRVDNFKIIDVEEDRSFVQNGFICSSNSKIS